MADVQITHTRNGNVVIEAQTEVGKKFINEYAMAQAPGIFIVSKEYLNDWLKTFDLNEISYEGV